MVFWPRRVFFEEDALEYELGDRLYRQFQARVGTEVKIIPSHNRVTGIPGKSPHEGYVEAKRTLVVGVRRSRDFQTCKPSAHFQLPLVTSCPGLCEYCYLNTTLGSKPYIRVYVNVDEVLERANRYIAERSPRSTVFEGAATSDPIPVEHLTGSLARAIAFFGTQELGRFRFVTKFTDVDSLLGVPHGGHTRFRFSLNTQRVIESFERGTPRLADRLDAATKVYEAGYPLGFIIAPILVYSGWEQEYRTLFQDIRDRLGAGTPDLTLEFITHRFTARAKANILKTFPGTRLPLDESERRFKFGQFGYGKYLYPEELFRRLESFFSNLAAEFFPDAKVEYFV